MKIRVVGIVCTMHCVCTTKLSSFQCHGRICGHDTENMYNNMYTGTRNAILAKHRLQLPNDGLCKPTHVGATVIILNAVIII